MMDYSRTQLLVGSEGIALLREARVAVFGLGGVGSYAVEGLARAGVGHLLLVDNDRVEPSNSNRQIIATDPVMGRPKTDVARERILLINKDAEVETLCVFIDTASLDSIFTRDFDYAIDAIDTIQSKVLLIKEFLHRRKIHISSMGAANRLSYTGIRVDDISRTRSCPMARVVRKKLREQGISTGIRCVYTEAAIDVTMGKDSGAGSEAEYVENRKPQGTISYLCGLMGLTASGVIINDILSGTKVE